MHCARAGSPGVILHTPTSHYVGAPHAMGIPLASPSLVGKSLMQMGSGEHMHSLGGTMDWPLRLLRAEGPSREQGDLTGRPWALGGQWSLPTQRQTLLSTKVAIAMTVPLYQKYQGPSVHSGKCLKTGKEDSHQLGCQKHWCPDSAVPKVKYGYAPPPPCLLGS